MCTEIDLGSVDRDIFFPSPKEYPERALWNGRSVVQVKTLGETDRTIQRVSCSKAFWLLKPFEMIGKGLLDPELIDSTSPLPQCELSTHFETAGCAESYNRIEGINGVSTLPVEALSHASYLKGFTADQKIGWVYNRTHSLLTDVSEVFFMNYLGYSPNTANLLLKNWTAFHEENQDNLGVKFLQFCHSQGALHVKNALLRAPLEVQSRIIVVAIAPAVVVPKGLCYQSFNYGSKKDFVHFFELSFLSAFDTNEFRIAKPLEMALAYREELILLDSKAAVEFDHDFQSPTFREQISDHIAGYLKQNGAYPALNENYSQALAKTL